MIDSSSAKTVMASSKLTPCFRRFAIAFGGSHSNFTRAVYLGRLEAANVPISAASARREEREARIHASGPKSAPGHDRPDQNAHLRDFVRPPPERTARLRLGAVRDGSGCQENCVSPMPMSTSRC